MSLYQFSLRWFNTNHLSANLIIRLFILSEAGLSQGTFISLELIIVTGNESESCLFSEICWSNQSKGRPQGLNCFFLENAPWISHGSGSDRKAENLNLTYFDICLTMLSLRNFIERLRILYYLKENQVYYVKTVEYQWLIDLLKVSFISLWRLFLYTKYICSVSLHFQTSTTFDNLWKHDIILPGCMAAIIVQKIRNEIKPRKHLTRSFFQISWPNSGVYNLSK